MASSSSEEGVQFHSVADHIVALDVKTVEKLYGKDTIFDPARKGYHGSFTGGRAASRAAASTFPEDVDKKDYAVPWTCRAVVRSMSSLAQLISMRLLYFEEVVPMKSARAWVHEQKVVSFRFTFLYKIMHLIGYVKISLCFRCSLII
jgi:hypothetical protein